MIKLSNGQIADRSNPPFDDTRLLREWLNIFDLVVEPDPVRSSDIIVTDCLCMGTGWIGKWPGGEVACSRHLPKLPYRSVNWR